MTTVTGIVVKLIIDVSYLLFEGYSYNQMGKPVKPIVASNNYGKLSNTIRPLEFGYTRVPAAFIITSDKDLKDNKLDTVPEDVKVGKLYQIDAYCKLLVQIKQNYNKTCDSKTMNNTEPEKSLVFQAIESAWTKETQQTFGKVAETAQ